MTTQADQPAFVSFLCHLAFWFGPLFATPLFITLTNREDVTLSAAWVAMTTALACLVFSFAGWKIMARGGPRIEWWVNRILLTLAFGIAIQGNVVHDLFYYGAFNGERVDFRADPATFQLEFWAYLLFFPLALWLFSRIARLSPWLPALPILSFCMLLIPSLVFVQTDDPVLAAETEIDPSVFAFSSSNNLIHLLPDGFQGDVVREVLQENPDLAARFEGFTIFTNHLGLYQGTAPALYTILTGEPFALENGFVASDVTDKVQAHSYPNDLAEAGFQLDYVPISPFICVEKANSCHARPFNDLKARGYFRHHNEDRSYSARLIADLTLFRLVPRLMKEKIYDQGNWFLSDTTLDGSSPWPAPVLRDWVENFHITDSGPVYKWYHFIGTHIPPHWDKQCRPQRDLELTRDNYKAQAYCVLDDIAKLLDRLKQAGIMTRLPW